MIKTHHAVHDIVKKYGGTRVVHHCSTPVMVNPCAAVQIFSENAMNRTFHTVLVMDYPQRVPRLKKG
jgi:hypothetical protein